MASTDNISITADTFELDGKKNSVVASGNVVVKQQDITVKGKRGRYYQKKTKNNLSRGRYFNKK